MAEHLHLMVEASSTASAVFSVGVWCKVGGEGASKCAALTFENALEEGGGEGRNLFLQIRSTGKGWQKLNHRGASNHINASAAKHPPRCTHMRSHDASSSSPSALGATLGGGEGGNIRTCPVTTAGTLPGTRLQPNTVRQKQRQKSSIKANKRVLKCSGRRRAMRMLRPPSLEG